VLLVLPLLLEQYFATCPEHVPLPQSASALQVPAAHVPLVAPPQLKFEP
jgi:hypothetical protein